MFLKRIQLGLIHAAVAMTLVPINSTLNRVMIHDLGLSAALVAILASLPYLFAPAQVVLGSYSDRHPWLGFRRTPYILLGLLLCIAGVIAAPQVAYLMAGSAQGAYLVALLVFAAWGMGYNLSSVSYLSLAAELSAGRGRGRTIAVMFFIMIIAIIGTALGVSRMVDPFSSQAMQQAFLAVGAAALVLGVLGMIRLEPRHSALPSRSDEAHTLREMLVPILNSPQVRLFFVYLLLLLTALLGQDVLLEPFAAQAFDMSVSQTTRITSIWGSAMLVALALAGLLERRFARRHVAQAGNLGALFGLVLIIAAGLSASSSLFYSGVILLGFGTGVSTVANLALMFELTLPGSVGLFMGAWGFANAMSRLLGNVMSGVVRDVAVRLTDDAVFAYLLVFALEAAMLAGAILLLTRLSVSSFHREVEQPEFYERIGALSD
jgi:BCD family chlorophyll transporter-like MFS transporter